MTRTWAVFKPGFWIIVLSGSIVGSLIYQYFSDPWRVFQSGMVAVETNDRSTIEKAIARLENVSAYSYQREYFQAVLAVKDGAFAEALKLADRARSHPDLSLQATVLAGEAAYKMGAPGNAKLYWEQALEMDSESIAAHRWLGVLYYDVGAMNEAILHLQAVSRLAPNDPRPDRLMGLMNRDYERPEIAIPHYQESLKRDPNQTEADNVRLELAECHIKLREYEVAMETLLQCQQSVKRDLLQARCLLNLGTLDDAKSLAVGLVDKDSPQKTEALQLNAEIALADGNPELAADFLKKAAHSDPYNHGVRTQLAQVLGRIGDAEGSKEQTTKAEELQVLWQRFSDLQIDAIDRLTDAPIRYEIGTLANKLGKPELAVVWFKAALAIDPRMRSASDALVETIQKLKGSSTGP